MILMLSISRNFYYGVFMLVLFIIGIILINPPALVILIWVVFKLIRLLLF